MLSLAHAGRVGASVARRGALAHVAARQASGDAGMGMFRPRLPINTGVVFTPQQEAWIVERFGKFHKTLSPGVRHVRTEARVVVADASVSAPTVPHTQCMHHS